MKKKMIYSLVIVFMMTMNVSVFAQQNVNKGGRCPYTPEQRMEIQTRQVVKSLMLDDETSQKFIPVYTNYLKDLHGVAAVCPVKRDKVSCNDLSDEEVIKMIDFRFEMSQKILDLRKKYYGEFQKFLTPRQILKIYSTERHHMERFSTMYGHKRNGRNHYGNSHCNSDGHSNGHAADCRQ